MQRIYLSAIERDVSELLSSNLQRSRKGVFVISVVIFLAKDERTSGITLRQPFLFKLARIKGWASGNEFLAFGGNKRAEKCQC